ncbi:hypothetical protein YC2023_031348 [Brassica napus]
MLYVTCIGVKTNIPSWSGLGQRITYSGSGVDHHGPYAQSGNTRRPNPPQRHYTSCGRSLSDESSPSSNVFDESDPPFRMFSDNQTLIRAINDKRFEKEIYGVVKDIKTSFSLFVDLSFFFLPRGENRQTDALAKFILRNPTYVMGRPTGENSSSLMNYR